MASAARAVDEMSVDGGEQFAYYRWQGYFAETPTNYEELPALVSTGKGRRIPNDCYLAVLLSLTFEDMATAVFINRYALERNLKTPPCVLIDATWV